MITQKQRNILEIITTYINDNNFPPTVRELAHIIGLKSTSTMHEHLEKLRKHGYITWDEGMPRTIQVVKQEKPEKIIKENNIFKVNCKELYRLPITIDLIEDFYKLGEAFAIKSSTVQSIYNIVDISDKLKIKWMIQYHKEWNEKVKSILKDIRTKAKLDNEEHIFTYDLKSKELIVIDMLRKDYQELCDEHSYLSKVKFSKQ